MNAPGARSNECGVAEREGASAVVGLGGGKAMDTAKAVGHGAGLKWACVPTIVSTDTPTSGLSVIYTDDGVYEEYILVDGTPSSRTHSRRSRRRRSTS